MAASSSDIYENTSGDKLCHCYIRTEIEEKLNVSIPLMIIGICIKYYQLIDAFIQCEGYDLFQRPRNKIKRIDKDRFEHIVNYGNIIIHGGDESLISTWKIKIINNMWSNNIFCEVIVGLIKYKEGDEKSRTILPYRTFYGINEDNEFIKSGTYKQRKFDDTYWDNKDNKIKGGDIIKIEVEPPKIHFSKNDEYQFSARINQEYDYKVFVSFTWGGGEAQILWFDQIEE